MRNFFAYLIIAMLLLTGVTANSQESIGMSTGNYAGVTSLWFNPANAADSRYKFDINLIGINSYFNNNYLLLKKGTFVRRLFNKDPYNSSYDAVRKDLLTEQAPEFGKVYGRVESNIHFPLSFMASLGKRAGFGITMNNRTINKVDSIPVDLARSFYSALRDPSLYNVPMQVDSMKYNFLNWQEVGLTYAHVLINSDHHMLKLGVTLKWLGANVGAYIQTDNARVSFRDSTTLSLQSPLIRYARTDRADIGNFQRKDIFNNVEDHAFGWDAGFVYEFRASVKKFKYIDESLEERTRRDKNKYLFRLGVSVVDMGRFTLNKRPLTNDHSANIVNWDFSNVKANNLSQFDTAYARQVSYIQGTPKTFTYRLPSALITNFDLHLLGGLYINLAAKAPFESFKKEVDTYISANQWVAVTPRFETKFLGVYVPIIRSNNRTQIGATVKFGPVYIGSNNLGQLLTNPTSYEADIHAGVRLSIPYGKPRKASKFLESLLKENNEREDSIDANRARLEKLEQQVADLRLQLFDSSRFRSAPVQVIINNDGGVSTVVDQNGRDSVVLRSNSAQRYQEQDYYNSQKQYITDSLALQLAASNVELNRLRQELDAEKSSSSKGSKKSKSNSKDEIEVKNSNDDIAKELERIRKQMAIQNAAIVGTGTATTVAVASGKDNGSKAGTAPADTAKAGVLVSDINSPGNLTPIQLPANVPAWVDTIYVRDTIRLGSDADNAAYKVVDAKVMAPVLFAVGSSTISSADKVRIADLAKEVSKHPDWLVELTGMTDATGSVKTNRILALERSKAVSVILLQNGVNESQLLIKGKLADSKNTAGSNPRRVELRILGR